MRKSIKAIRAKYSKNLGSVDLKKVVTRAKMEIISQSEVDSIMSEMSNFTLTDLQNEWKRAGFEVWKSTSKKDLLKKMRSLLSAGLRVMAQTAH